MADTARGIVLVTPVVTVAADADSDSVDVIHHDIGGSVGGKLEYEKADANDKWFYDASKDLSTSSADLISGDFTEGGTVDRVNDRVKFLSVTHLGIDDNGDTTTDGFKMTLSNSDPTAASDAILLSANESVILKLGVVVGSIKAISTANHIIVKIVAIIDDVV